MKQSLPSLENAESWRKTLAKMSHILGNKLFALSNINQLLERILPGLLKGYHLAIEHELMHPAVNPKLIEMLSKTSIEESTTSMFQVLETVLSLSQDLCNQDKVKEALSAKTLIDSILNAFEFQNTKREWIEFNPKGDFNIFLSDYFLRSAIVQFLSFSQDQFKNQRQVHIYFSKQDQEFHTINFKIISTEIQANYDYFLNNPLIETSGTVIPGIDFCRLALSYINGDIFCHIQEKQYIEFIILIPKH